MMSWSRASRTSATFCRLPSSSLIWPFLAATLVESRETPSRAAWNSSGVLRVSSASVVRDSASRSVSIRSEVSASPEKASTTSYGELVRVTGISSPSGS